MVIVGVDFSAGSAAAVSVALSLAARDAAGRKLLHVASHADLHEPGESEREAWTDALGLTRDDVEVRRGIPWVELVLAVGESDASLLVVGTHGQSGFQPLRLGRTAELIALRSPVPVVLVPRMNPTAPAVFHAKATSEEVS